MSNKSLPQLNKTATDQLLDMGLMVEAVLYPDSNNMAEAVSKLLGNPGLIIFLNATVPNIKDSLELLQALLPVLPHDNLGTPRAIGMGVAMILTILIVGLRLFSRWKLTKKLWPEDWWAIVALVWVIAVNICYVLTITVGVEERHIYDVPYQKIKTWLMLYTIAHVIFNLGLVPIKMTFIVFYYRLSPDKIYRRALIALVILIVAIAVLGVFLVMFQCTHVDYWNYLFTPEYKCFDRVKANSIWGGMTVATDIALLLLPIWQVSKLKIRSKSEKMMVIGMFAAGGLVCIVNILRVLAFNLALESTDLSYQPGAVGNWGPLEADLSIVISCLPALKHLIIGHKITKTLSELSSKIIRSTRRKPVPNGSDGITETEGDSRRDIETGVTMTDFSKDEKSIATHTIGSTIASRDEESMWIIPGGLSPRGGGRRDDFTCTSPIQERGGELEQ